MMQIDSIYIKNFGPYQEEIFEIDSKPGVTIVWGNNGSGKTTLLNIIKYAFFGEFFGGKHKKDPKMKTFNRIAMKNGESSFYVLLKMTFDGSKYELKREQRLKIPGVIPSSDADFKEIVSLKKDNNILSTEERDSTLNHIMPKDISRFFFFDGELLKEYEELIEDDSDQGTKIKEAIEKILGLPALKMSSQTVKEVETYYEDKFIKASRDDRANIKNIEAHQKLQERINNAENQLSKDKKELEDLNKEKEYLSQEMRSNQKITELLAKKSSAESELKKEREFYNNSKENLLNECCKLWKPMISERAQDAMAKIDPEYQDLNSKIANYNNFKHVQESNPDICPFCRRPIENHISIPAVPEPTLEENERLAELTVVKSTLNKIIRSENTISTVEIYEKNLHDHDSNIYKLEADIKKYDEEMGMSNEETKGIEDLQEELLKCGKKIQILEESIKNTIAQIEEDKQQKDKLYQLMKNYSSGESKILSAKKTICQEIHEILSDSITKYRDSLKINVERDASALFLKMVDHGYYSALKINDNYGLELVDMEGDIVPARSSGYEQMVAFALIGGLHKNAPIEGPTIIDYPFGRISNDNKPRVATIFPELGKQVVFLPFFGEIDDSELRNLLEEKLLKEYKLVHESTYITHIEKY